MRQALWLSFQVSEPGSPGAGIVKVRHTSSPVLTSKPPTQLLVPSEPPVDSPCTTSSRPPAVLMVKGAPENAWVFDGVPVLGSIGAAACTSHTTSPESRLSAIRRASYVERKILLPYMARPRVVRDTRIFGSYRQSGIASVPLRTSNFITRDQVS